MTPDSPLRRLTRLMTPLVALGLATIMQTPAADAAPIQDGEQAGSQQREGRRARQRRGGQTREIEPFQNQDGAEGRRGGRGQGRGGGGGGRMRGFGNMGASLQPEFVRRDLNTFVQGLELDDGQQSIVKVLLEDYESAFEAAVEPTQTQMDEIRPRIFQSMMSEAVRNQFREGMREMQAEIELMRDGGQELDREAVREMMRERMTQLGEQAAQTRVESGDDARMRSAMNELFTAMEQWRVERDALRNQFLAGVEAQLGEHQEAMWPAFRRELTRAKALPRGRISGESVDLFVVLNATDIEPNQSPELEELMEAYDIRMDEALRARDDYMVQSEPRLFRSIQEQDTATGLEIVARQAELRARVRDVNEEFRLAVAGLLEDEQSKAFATEAKSRAFGRIYRTTAAQRSFEFARGLEIAPETLEAIDSLEVAYLSELDAFNERMIATMKEAEPKEIVQEAERFAGFMTGQFSRRDRGADPVRGAFQERRELDDRYIERLSSLLTPDQVQDMPGRRNGGGGFENLPDDVRQRILERADTNGNGTIDPDEEEAARNSFRRRGFGGRGFGGEGGGEGGRRGGGGGET